MFQIVKKAKKILFDKVDFLESTLSNRLKIPENFWYFLHNLRILKDPKTNFRHAFDTYRHFVSKFHIRAGIPFTILAGGDSHHLRKYL